MQGKKCIKKTSMEKQDQVNYIHEIDMMEFKYMY